MLIHSTGIAIQADMYVRVCVQYMNTCAPCFFLNLAIKTHQLSNQLFTNVSLRSWFGYFDTCNFIVVEKYSFQLIHFVIEHTTMLNKSFLSIFNRFCLRFALTAKWKQAFQLVVLCVCVSRMVFFRLCYYSWRINMRSHLAMCLRIIYGQTCRSEYCCAHFQFRMFVRKLMASCIHWQQSIDRIDCHGHWRSLGS